jgi:hypothetical protein
VEWGEMGGGVVWPAEGTGRGSQESPGSRVIADTAVIKKQQLRPNHPGRNEIVHPVLLAALLAQMG